MYGNAIVYISSRKKSGTKTITEISSFTVMADRDKLQIIINNLVGNALKYSQENSLIEINLDKEESISIKIKNKIRKDIHPNNLDLKKRFHYAKPLDGEGSGLGLWISNQLATIHGFELSVSIIEGTMFESTLLIPLTNSD